MNDKKSTISIFLTLIPFSCTYFLSYTLADENFVNFEHAYNLYHFGKFSFSKETIVDGTVEFIYFGTVAKCQK